MKKIAFWIGLASLSLVITACSSPDSFRVYSSGFSFERYDYVMIAKPGRDTSTLLYGMDIQLANLLAEYNMNVVGDKQIKSMPLAERQKLLIARMSMEAGNGRIALTISFDDAVTGKTGASFTTTYDGDIYDPEDRNDVLDKMTSTLKKALQQGKNLQINGPVSH